MINLFSSVWLLNFAAALLLAPLLFGIIAKVKAFFAGRKGISLFQLYFDIIKLLKRGVIYSTSTSVFFRFAPCVTLAATVCAAALLPADASFLRSVHVVRLSRQPLAPPSWLRIA